MREYTQVRDEGALVAIPTAYASRRLVICSDRLVEHSHMEQSDWRYRAEEIRFEDIEAVRRDRESVFLDLADEGHHWYRFEKIRPAQAFERVSSGPP